MSYTAPYIDSQAGLVIPTYIDIRDDLIEQFKGIYGQDCYLETDSADYQWICIVALRIYDALQSVQLAYNNRAPGTAIGSGLDQIVKMNGIARKAATYSTCEVVLTGTIGTIITNGVVSDSSGYKWDLPASVTLISTGSPATGQATVTATCQTVGAISALIGDITIITTPTAGWTAVENLVAASIGTAVETDAALRTRQSLSVLRPSTDLVGGTIAGIASIETVTRYNVVENATNADDIHGNPPHSITCVVEGGTNAEVAEEIWLNRGIGVYTNGDVEYDYIDPITFITTTIRFYRPVYVPIYVTATVYPLTGYTTATENAIQIALSNYLNALQIGEDVTVSALYAAAMAATSDLYKPTFSITELTIGKVVSPQDAVDIVLDFNETAYGEIENITINTPSEYPD
jgi:uncharacterized phage protein gp47/JayE